VREGGNTIPDRGRCVWGRSDIQGEEGAKEGADTATIAHATVYKIALEMWAGVDSDSLFLSFAFHMLWRGFGMVAKDGPFWYDV
jgi:hypothetical protein